MYTVVDIFLIRKGREHVGLAQVIRWWALGSRDVGRMERSKTGHLILMETCGWAYVASDITILPATTTSLLIASHFDMW